MPSKSITDKLSREVALKDMGKIAWRLPTVDQAKSLSAQVINTKNMWIGIDGADSGAV